MPFTLLPAFNSEWELTIFFIIGLISTIFFITGYKTKFFQIISTIVVLSIHNKVSTIENGGDMVINNYLIWSLFLPLGSVWSIDSLIKSLNENYENSSAELNNLSHDKNYKIYSFAFFICLFQLCMIYFFNHTNKTGNDWKNSLALHYFFQLDTFLTPFGYYVKGILSESFLKFLSNFYFVIIGTVPLFFIPYFTKWIRLFYFIFFISFHGSVALFVSIGVFSYIMMTIDIFLLGNQIVELIRKVGNKITGKAIIVFYPNDNIRMHQFARVFSRLDVFKKINWYMLDNFEQSEGNNYFSGNFVNNEKQIIFNGAILFHILNKIPFGFLISWLFIIPGINKIVKYFLTKNQNKITHSQNYLNLMDNSQNKIFRHLKLVQTIMVSFVLFCLLFANVHRALVVNEPTKSSSTFREYQFNRKVLNYLRMKQNWKMFAPNVLKNEKILVVDLLTEDNQRIDPFTGRKPINTSVVDFQIQDVNYGQFVRKFMKRSTKTDNSTSFKEFEKWLMGSIKDINGKKYSKTKSFNIWKLSEYSPKPNSSPTKIRKKLISEYHVDRGIKNNNKYRGRKRNVSRHKKR